MIQDNYFYETPRLPMFFLMEDARVVRVRALRYKNGWLDAVLADWGVDNLQKQFYEKDVWHSDCEEPFYCLYKNEDGELMHPWQEYTIKEWVRDEAKDNIFTEEELYDFFMKSANRVHCPIFDSYEEANNYIFRL